MAQYLDLAGLGTLVTNIKTQISNAIANKQDKQTTLAGYGITDAKITNGVITLGSNTITPLTSHQSLSNYSTLANTIKCLSVSGTTITYTKGDGTTDTITTQDTNTTYSAATTSASGLMSASDKTKLDGISNDANNYVLPSATNSSLGGIKVGDGLQIDANGVLSTDKTKSESLQSEIDALELLVGDTSVASQISTSISTKQDTISDLATIRSGAGLGATAQQPATTISGYGITDAYTKSEVDALVSSVYKYKGSVASFSALPTSNHVAGDVYNVEDTGANYAWNGIAWDKLSETVDLSGKQDKLDENQLAKLNDTTVYAPASSVPTKVSDLTNDSGFTTNTGTVTSVNNTTPVNGNVTIAIPTVTDTYSSTSTDAMSGIAVKQAIDSALGDVDSVLTQLGV